MGDVTDFTKASERLKKQLEKGKTPTKKAALNAMIENNELLQGLFQTINRLASTQMQLEKYLQQIDTNLRVLGKTLTDKNVFTEEEFEQTWNNMVEKPKEEALQKHIDNLKAGAAEDAFFGACLELTKKHVFEDEMRGAQKVSGLEVRNFFIQMLVNPATRNRVLDDLRKYIPELPTFNPQPAVVETAGGVDDSETTPESRTMPACRYCGDPNCEFCKNLESEKQPTIGGHSAPECCEGTEESCCLLE